MKAETEAKFIEFTAQHLWKFCRPFVSRHLARRCQKCVLPESFSPLDVDGVCEVCRSHTPVRSHKPLTSRLANRIQEAARIQPESRTHDALILLSGGKDSAYLLDRVRSEFPNLRLLTLTVDNGYLSPVALHNIQHILKLCPSTHWHFRLDPKNVARVFRFAFQNLSHQTGYSIVDLLDGLMTFQTARKLAAGLKIPLILCGLNPTQFESAFGPAQLDLPVELELAGLSRISSLKMTDVIRQTGPDFWFQEGAENSPQFLLPFFEWSVSETEILEHVQTRGLIPAGRSRPLLTNNALIPLIGIAEVAQFGYSCWEVEFARMVREGKSDRHYWLNMFEMLEYSTRTGAFVSSGVRQMVTQLGLNAKAMKLPKTLWP